MRKQFECEDVQHWAQKVISQHRCVASLVPEFYQHTAQCLTCEGALMALTFTEPDLFPPFSVGQCASCQADVPALIDYESLEPGVGVAAFPKTWWHVISCAECAADLALLLRMLQASDQLAASKQSVDMLMGSELAAFQSSLVVNWGTIVVPRQLLNVSAPRLQRYQSQAIRGQRTAQVMARTSINGHQIQVSFDPYSPQAWNMKVQVQPPVMGMVRAVIRGNYYEARFGKQGEAQLVNIPNPDLFASEEPDLALELAVQLAA